MEGGLKKGMEENKETNEARDVGNSFESLALLQHLHTSSILEGLKG